MFIIVFFFFFCGAESNPQTVDHLIFFFFMVSLTCCLIFEISFTLFKNLFISFVAKGLRGIFLWSWSGFYQIGLLFNHCLHAVDSWILVCAFVKLISVISLYLTCSYLLWVALLICSVFFWHDETIFSLKCFSPVLRSVGLLFGATFVGWVLHPSTLPAQRHGGG